MSTVRLLQPSKGAVSQVSTPPHQGHDVIEASKKTPGDQGSGTSLPNLKLGELLGRGAFGSVYKALDTETGEVIAAKRIALGNIEARELPSIMSEIDLLRNLSHPNVVQYRGFAKTDDYLYIFTELCDGSLHSIGKKFGRFPENLVQVYVYQILTGLAYLHDEGCVHRDIKASNLLATKDGGVKLADFGVATRVGAQLGDALASEAVVGSPYWMSPEVITQSQNGAPSSAADIWATGCTTIELLSGQPPYGNLDCMGALFRIVSDDCPPLPDSASPIVRDFIVQCLQKDPNLRISAKKLLRHPWMVSAKRRLEQKSADAGRCTPLGERSPNRVLPSGVEEILKDWNRALEKDGSTFRRGREAQSDYPKQGRSRHGLDVPPRKRRSLEGLTTAARPSKAVSLDPGHLLDITSPGQMITPSTRDDHDGLDEDDDNNWDDDFEMPSQPLASTTGGLISSPNPPPISAPLQPQRGSFEGKVAGLKRMNERSQYLRPGALISNHSSGTREASLDRDQSGVTPVDSIAPASPPRKRHLHDFSESEEDWSDVFSDRSHLDNSAKVRSFAVDAAASQRPWMGDPESSDEDDPFAEVEEDQTEEASFEANVARDRLARLLSAVSDMVDRMTSVANEQSLKDECLQLIDLLEAHAETKHQFIRSHGMLGTIELLQQFKRSGEITSLLLRIVNLVINENPESLEKLCVNGGCPVVMEFAAPTYSRQIRLEAALFIGAMCQTSVLTLQMFISCRGLASLVALMDQSYDEQKDLIYLAVSGICCVFDLQGPTPRNDFCRMFAHEGLLEPLSEALVRVNEETDELASSARRRIAHIFLLFSQADLSVKNSVLTRPITLRLVKSLDSLDGEPLCLLLKAIKNLSSAPSGLTCLQHAGALEILTAILKQHAEQTSPWTNDIANAVVNTLFNLCRLSKARQEEAALAGAIPPLQKIVDRNSPLKQFALPILCDFAHTSKTCRKLLWQKDGFNFYVRLLQDPFFGVIALESILAWLSDETSRIDEAINSQASRDALIRLFINAKAGALENLADPFLRLFRLSASVARHLTRDYSFVEKILERLSAATKAAVRLNLLRLIRAAFEAHVAKSGLPAHYENIVLTAEALAQSDPSVLVRELAKDLRGQLGVQSRLPSIAGKQSTGTTRAHRSHIDDSPTQRTMSPTPRVRGGMFERLVKKNAVSHRRASSRS